MNKKRKNIQSKFKQTITIKNKQKEVEETKKGMYEKWGL